MPELQATTVSRPPLRREQQSQISQFTPGYASWVRKEDWSERIITFDPSWFTVAMGTGISVQLLANFPYQAQWLRNLAYCFWILDIVLFAFFTAMSLLRLFLYPKVAMNIMHDFTQTSFLGTIPVALDTIIVGIIVFYSRHPAAVWTALGFYWVSVFLALVVIFGGVFVVFSRQGEVQLSNVTGVWLLTFIPPIVVSATGAVISSHLDQRAGVAVLVVSFMSLSLGLGMCSIIIAIYFWRLMKCKLPAREAIISCFVPVGPPGMGAYAIQNLAIGLAAHISKYKFTLEHAPQPPVSAQMIGAIAEGVHWLGVILSFCLLAIATFFLVEAFASLWAKSPRSFNIGFWSFVFPCGVYANGVCMLGSDIRNEGLKGYGAACAVGTVLLWLGCALVTFYKSVWRGKLFFAPGLQGWLEQEQLDERRKPLSGKDTNAIPLHNVQSLRSGHALGSNGADEYGGNLVHISSSTDGTYVFSRRVLDDGQHAV